MEYVPETLLKDPSDHLPSGVDHYLSSFDGGDPIHPAQRKEIMQ